MLQTSLLPIHPPPSWPACSGGSSLTWPDLLPARSNCLPDDGDKQVNGALACGALSFTSSHHTTLSTVADHRIPPTPPTCPPSCIFCWPVSPSAHSSSTHYLHDAMPVRKNIQTKSWKIVRQSFVFISIPGQKEISWCYRGQATKDLPTVDLFRVVFFFFSWNDGGKKTDVVG